MTALDSNLAWGERDALYPKSFDYVFSLEATFWLMVPAVLGSTVPLRLLRGAVNEWDTFHVLDEAFMRTPNGIQQQVPRAKLVFGSDAILIADDGAVSLDGTLVFETDTPDRLSMHYTGVLNLAGGTQRLCVRPPAEGNGPTGSAHIASVQDVANPKYRWMVQNQLIGVGQVTSWYGSLLGAQPPDPQAPPLPSGKNWFLKFDYDLYIAS